MSLLVPTKKSKIAKITASSSLVTLKDKKIGGGAFVKKKISENNNKLITITNKLNEIQEVQVRTEKIQINQLKAEPAAEEKIKTEKLLETKPEKKERKRKDSLKVPKPSKPNLVDRIFQFLALTGLNWLIGKLSDKTSGIGGIFDFIQNVLENIVEWFPKFLDATFKFFEIVGPWIQGIGQFVFNAFVGAIDLAYQTYDGLRSLTGTIFGDKGVEKFDEFSGILSDVIAGAITLATAMILFSDDLKGFGGDGLTDGLTNNLGSRISGALVKGGKLTVAGTASVVTGAGLLASALGEGAFQLREKGREVEAAARSNYEKHKDKWVIDPRRAFSWGLLQAARYANTSLSMTGFMLDVVGAPFRYAIELIRYPFLSEEDKEKQAANLAKFDARIREDVRKALNMVTLGLAFKEKGSFGNLYNNDTSQEEMMNRMGNGGGQELNSGGRVKIGSQDFRDLAYIVSGEAARNTNDEYGVAAAVLNRVASPVWPNNVRSVGFQAGQFEAVYTGKAKDDPMLAEKLSSPEGQAKIASAMRLLNGRTDFKGQSMLANKGSTDIMFHPRGNFFHYTSQRRKNDPAPANPDQSWKKLIGSGGPKIDLSTTSATSSSSVTQNSKEQKEQKEQTEMKFNPLGMLLNKLGINGNTSEQSEQIGSPTNTPAQISSSPSPALSTVKSNITKTSQSLPYQKRKSKPAVKVSVLVKENTRNIIT